MAHSKWSEIRASKTPLTFRGVPVLPRFDLGDRDLRTLWAGIHGLTLRVQDSGGDENDLRHLIEIAAIDRGLTATVTRTADGIEVDARR